MLLKNAMLAAIFAVNSLSSAFVRTNDFWRDQNADATPAPGAAQIFLNVPSMSTLLKDAATFVPYYAIRGKSFEVDKEVKVAGIDLSIKQVNITDFVIGDASMAFVGTTDTIRTTLKNIDVTLNMDALVKKGLIKLELTEVKLMNLTMQLDMATSSDDQVHWQLTTAPLLSLEGMNATVAQKVWQKTINKLIPVILAEVNFGLKLV